MLWAVLGTECLTFAGNLLSSAVALTALAPTTTRFIVKFPFFAMQGAAQNRAFKRANQKSCRKTRTKQNGIFLHCQGNKLLVLNKTLYVEYFTPLLEHTFQ